MDLIVADLCVQQENLSEIESSKKKVQKTLKNKPQIGEPPGSIPSPKFKFQNIH